MFYLYDNVNNYTDDNYKEMYNNLNQISKDKIDKLVNVRDKKLSILSKHLLKTILSQKYDLDYNNIYYNEYGKPLIDGICFNISHSFDYVVLAFSNNYIGIDVEKIRKVNLNVINSFYTEKEKKYILNAKEKYKSIFEIFCLKEAYFKMLGTNLFNMKNMEINNIGLNIKTLYDIPNYIISIVEKIGE